MQQGTLENWDDLETRLGSRPADTKIDQAWCMEEVLTPPTEAVFAESSADPKIANMARGPSAGSIAAAHQEPSRRLRRFSQERLAGMSRRFSRFSQENGRVAAEFESSLVRAQLKLNSGDVTVHWGGEVDLSLQRTNKYAMPTRMPCSPGADEVEDV